MKLKWILIAALLSLVPATANAQLRAKVNLGATTHSATLTWTEGTTCASPCTITFNVFRGTTPGGESTTALNSSPVTALTYTDSAVSLGTTYYYVVEAVETSGSLVLTSPNSNEVSATFPSAPTAPVLGVPGIN